MAGEFVEACWARVFGMDVISMAPAIVGVAEAPVLPWLIRVVSGIVAAAARSTPGGTTLVGMDVGSEGSKRDVGRGQFCGQLAVQ